MDAALNRLKSGSLDYIEALQPVQACKRHVEQSDSTKNSRNTNITHRLILYLGWNNDHPIFRDKRVRQAMTYFTDRKQIVKSVLFGLGEVVDSHIYLFRPEYDKSLVGYPFDPLEGYGAACRGRLARHVTATVCSIRIIDGKKTPLRFEIKVNSGNAVAQKCGTGTSR